jgi:signal transduction histidine kinase
MERAFMSDAAHELKTAIAVVRSSIQVIALRERTVTEYRSGLDDILKDNERVEALVTQMLLSACFDEKTYSVALLTDLGEEVTQAVGAVSRYADLRSILVRVETVRGLQVRLSPEAVQSLTTSLVMNALQHSSAGSEVRVRVTPGTAPRECTLEVQDFGSGIHPDVLPHVFERFFRADPSRSRETGGAGLGLSICKSIVDRTGGTISIESTLGSGTRVTVRLISDDASQNGASTPATV